MPIILIPKKYIPLLSLSQFDMLSANQTICVFDSVLTKIDFESTHSVKLIMIKIELKVK